VTTALTGRAATAASAPVLAVLNKMVAAGVPLEAYCGGIHSGISSAAEHVFVIDRRTRDQLVAQDASSAEILKPYLAAKDIRPWRIEARDRWLIYTHPGIEMNRYPAVMDYLRTFRATLEERPRRGRSAWYELRRARETLASALTQPKLVFPSFSNGPRCALDSIGHYVSRDVYFVAGADRYLQGIIGSRMAWFFLIYVSAATGTGYYRLYLRDVKRLPIPRAPESVRKVVAVLAERLSGETCPDRLGLEAELNDRIAALYGLTTDEERRLVEGLPLAPVESENEASL
jgi:hypothetical protein